MMAFRFREFTNLLDKGKRFPEIAKSEAPLNAMRFLLQLPVWDLCVKELGLLAREWRNSSATGSTGFANKSFGHVACLSCQPLPVLTLANCKVITALLRPVGSVEPISGPNPYGAGAVCLNHRLDLVRSIGVCPASPPTLYSRLGALF